MSWLKYALFMLAVSATQVLASPGGQPPTCC